MGSERAFEASVEVSFVSYSSGDGPRTQNKARLHCLLHQIFGIAGLGIYREIVVGYDVVFGALDRRSGVLDVGG